MAGPAVEATQKALKFFGPSLLAQTYWDAAKKPSGGWLPRLQAAPGPHKDKNKDPHAAGRALDIILFAKNPLEKDYAERIIPLFLRLRQKMRFISVIYNGWEWNGGGVKFPHVDTAHKTHIHIEWGQTGVGLADFASDLEDALYNEFSKGNLASGDYGLA
ncbi:MAG: hypothetical protein HYR55_18645 [Acidobacteria bacterium]|nr:hypothetical protein [Acidobacteriota bacterium]MBI3655035.1 hypothetical protein [Acidobacteriota bacterium]